MKLITRSNLKGLIYPIKDVAHVCKITESAIRYFITKKELSKNSIKYSIVNLTFRNINDSISTL